MADATFLYMELKEDQTPVNNYVSLLPESDQQKAVKFLHWRDYASYVMGKVLLRKGFQMLGFDFGLTDIRLSPYGKPYVDANIDFSISHSGDYVGVCLANDIRIGLDFEVMTAVELETFDPVMSVREMDEIRKSNQPLETLYSYWTIKESVIKADGRGLSAPVRNIIIEGRRAVLDGNTWHITELHFDQRYKSHMVSNKCGTRTHSIHVSLSDISFNQL